MAGVEQQRVGVLRLVVVCCVLMCGTLVCGGCGSLSSRSTPSAGPAPSTGPARQSVPLTVNRTPDGSSCVMVDVSVGGGRPVPVVVDTGSSGLLLDAAAVGPNAQASGRTFTEGFTGAPRVTGPVMNAQVSIGGSAGVTTPDPVAIGSVASDAALFGFSRCGGAQGLLGIGVGNPGPSAPPLESPLVQLTPSLSEGYTITLTDHAGTLLVGKPVVTSTSVVLPLREEDGTYPNGHRAYQRDVTLCWTVGSVSNCGLTDIDTGYSFPAIQPGFLPMFLVQGPLITSGTQVSITAPNGATLQSFTTAPAPADVRLEFSGLFGSTAATTGIGFFFANSVGFDVSTGHVVITPK